MLDDEVLRLVDRAHRGEASATDALERAFSCSQRLASYGTLAPGGPNHHQLAPCRGTWSLGTVPGRRADRLFPVFTYDPSAPRLPVHWLASPQLPQHWERLDRFEGTEYRRILVPVFEAGGTGKVLTVAYLYAARVPVLP